LGERGGGGKMDGGPPGESIVFGNDVGGGFQVGDGTQESKEKQTLEKRTTAYIA